MLGYPPTPPGGPVADRPTRRPPRFGSTKGGGRGPPPPFGRGVGVPPPPPLYSPPNCRTPLAVIHWLAAAPVAGADAIHPPFGGSFA